MRCVSSLLFVTLLLPIPAHGQTTASGTIRGVARDQQGAVVPGVVVSAASATVPGVRAAVTDRLGRYRLDDLLPGDYTIAGELAGFARFVRAPVTMRAGLNLEVDLVMQLGAIDETIEVREDTPLIETERAGQAINVSGELLRSIPLFERREWSGALAVAPGVTSWEWINNERMFSVHGAEPASNVVQIDGADVTPSIGSATLHVGLSGEAIDDIQIKTSGTDASAPLGQGGIINIATASGTNQVKGAAALSVQPRAWNASNTPGGTSSTVDQRQTDLALGAPIVKDRLWAFGAYRYTDARMGVSRAPAQLEALRALVPGYVPLDSANESHFWIAKLTAQLSPAHQATGFYQRDVNPTLNGDAVGARFSKESNGGMATSVRLSSIWSDRLTTRLAASYNDKRRDQPDPGLGVPFQRVYLGTVLSAGRPIGNGGLINLGSPITASTRQPNSKLTVSFDATFVATHRSGSHQLQAGLYAQPRVRTGRSHVYINDGLVIEEQTFVRPGDYSAGLRTFHRTVMDTLELTANEIEGQDYAVYFQDAWRPTPRLTINAGVRVDAIAWRDELFDMTSLRSTEVGPRVGVNYAVTADSHNVVRAHWVRVHDRPSQMAAPVGSVALGQRDFYDVDANGTLETVFVTPPTAAVTRGRTIDEDLHLPFIQEWGAGYTRQLAGRASIGVDLVRRDYRDRATLVETNGRYEGSRFVGYLDESFNETYLTANNEWNWPVYTSLELSLTKRSARIQGIASYVRQWRHMEGTWQPHDPASFIQPSAFANDRGIGPTFGLLAAPLDANSLSGSHMAFRTTATGQWQDHAVRGAVSYAGPWGLLVASSYTFQSGVWSGPIVTRIASADPAFGPSMITLSNGRAVLNPLATNIRFAYPNRGEGQLTTPDFHAWNLRVGRRFAVGGVKLDAALDVFNATNHDADLGYQTGANQDFNPVFGLTAFRQLPRSAQIALRVAF